RKPLIERKRRERINNCLDHRAQGSPPLTFPPQTKHLESPARASAPLTLCVLSRTADSKVGLEAQQRYSTGYIQCMHEVHNLLLTCEWMDKSLGARLLNHLLKSLPRSGEDPCKAALRSGSPAQQPLPTQKSAPSPKGSARGTSPAQERLYPAENKQASKNSLQLPSLALYNQVDAAPPRQVLQPNFSHNNPRMGSLDMWRPW
uniref:Orange domain-containing protein n=1 Tax=Serinus canaria TaxID=9135 RepID=A0A8C9NWB2_SERCA